METYILAVRASKGNLYDWIILANMLGLPNERISRKDKATGLRRFFVDNNFLSEDLKKFLWQYIGKVRY